MVDQSMRGFLALLEAKGELHRVTREIDPRFEIASVLTLCDRGAAQVFEAVRGHSMPVVGNLFATRTRFADALTGASGHIYGIRLLETLRRLGLETHLVMSRSSIVALAHETDFKLKDVQVLADHVHGNEDVAASISSGSFRTRGMIIAPCTTKTLGEIASGACSTLVSRAADVTLKERRRLVLMVRETPLHLGHCRNMVSVTEYGAIVMPPVPAFYTKPQTIDDIVNHTVGRALDLFDLDSGGITRWREPPEEA